MKQRMFHTAFWLILAIFEGLKKAVAKGGCSFCVFWPGFKKWVSLLFWRPILPVALAMYLCARKYKNQVRDRFKTSKGNFWWGLSHRYVAHSVLMAVALLVATPALQASSGAVFGSRMLLQEIIGEEDIFGAGEGSEVLVEDDAIPVEEVDSYLEALFQDQPLPESVDPGVPLALEGEVLLNQELPGFVTPLTRTEIVEYQVAPGDSPWTIAERFGISVATVLWENNLSLWSTIRPGQTLKILPVSGVSHTVKKGETLESVVKKYHAALAEVQEYNPALKDKSLAVGTVLVIPGARPVVAAPAKPVYRREIVGTPAQVVPAGTKLAWPTPTSKRITQYFWWRHAGLDVGDKSGNSITAVEAGIVEYAGWGRGGWGNMVLIDHGSGLKTRYAHASKVLVQQGQAVVRGEQIALIGSTGRSTGPHLHLSVYRNGRPVNPLEYLR